MNKMKTRKLGSFTLLYRIKCLKWTKKGAKSDAVACCLHNESAQTLVRYCGRWMRKMANALLQFCDVYQYTQAAWWVRQIVWGLRVTLMKTHSFEHTKRGVWFKLKCSTLLSSAHWSCTSNFFISFTPLKKVGWHRYYSDGEKGEKYQTYQMRCDFAIYTLASLRKILISENKSEHIQFMLFSTYMLQLQKSKHQQTCKLWFLRMNMENEKCSRFFKLLFQQTNAQRWEKNEFLYYSSCYDAHCTGAYENSENHLKMWAFSVLCFYYYEKFS